MEKELKASLAKLYQNYDFVTDEYDRLFDIVDSMREDYNNTKSMLLYHRYNEYKRLIKNAIRKWSAVEKRSTLNISRKQSNASFAQAINNSNSLNRMNVGPGMPGISEDGTTNYSSNLNVRLRANRGNHINHTLLYPVEFVHAKKAPFFAMHKVFWYLSICSFHGNK